MFNVPFIAHKSQRGSSGTYFQNVRSVGVRLWDYFSLSFSPLIQNNSLFNCAKFANRSPKGNCRSTVMCLQVLLIFNSYILCNLEHSQRLEKKSPNLYLGDLCSFCYPQLPRIAVLFIENTKFRQENFEIWCVSRHQKESRTNNDCDANWTEISVSTRTHEVE